MTGENIAKAMRLRGYIQVLDAKENVLDWAAKTTDCASFRVTQRGRELIEDEKKAVEFPFDKHDPPLSIRLWKSAFQRWIRNCPKGLFLAYSDDHLHILARDSAGIVKDDPAHRLISIKAPWISS